MNMNPFDPNNQPPAAETPPAQPIGVQTTEVQSETVTTIPQPEVNVTVPQPEQTVTPAIPAEQTVTPAIPAEQTVTPAQAASPIEQPVQNQPTQTMTPGPVAQPAPTVTPATPATPTPAAQVAQPQGNPMMPQSNVQQQTAAVNGFAPIMQPGQSVVSRFSPAKFDAFVKVLNVLDDKNIIVIDQSRICQSINNGTAILMTDVSGLIDDSNNKINLHVLNPKKYIKYFKNMKGSSDIYIIDDPNGQRYIVTNGDVMIYLPKQIEEFERDAAPPDLTAANLIGAPIDIDKDTRNTIISMSSETSHIDLLLHQNQMKAVYIPELAVFSFKQFVADQIDDSKAELRLRSYSFLNVPGEEYRVTLGEVQGNYWITTLVNTGFIAVHIIESLQPVSDENLIL